MPQSLLVTEMITLVFHVDGKYEVNEGTTKCNASDSFIVESGTWKFAQNETILVLTMASGSTIVTKDATIEVLDANTFAYTYVKAVVGVNYTFKESYEH